MNVEKEIDHEESQFVKFVLIRAINPSKPLLSTKL
jgi:hypothetical protein